MLARASVLSCPLHTRQILIALHPVAALPAFTLICVIATNRIKILAFWLQSSFKKQTAKAKINSAVVLQWTWSNFKPDLPGSTFPFGPFYSPCLNSGLRKGSVLILKQHHRG